MARYVIGDIHGHYDMFMEMLDFIKFKKTDNLYILGDCIDRGEQNAEVLEFVRDNENVESLIGNHELMMINDIFISNGHIGMEYDGVWDNNGGGNTLRQFRRREEEKSGYTKEMLKFVKSWNYHKIIEMDGYSIVLVHAGFWDGRTDWDIEKMLKRTPNFEKVWMRDTFLTDHGPKNIVTIFGHTPVSYMHKRVLKKVYVNGRGNKVGIDCGVYRDNILGCINIDAQEEFYIVKDKNSGKYNRKKGEQRVLWDASRLNNEECEINTKIKYTRTYKLKKVWKTKGYDPHTNYYFEYNIDDVLKKLNERCHGNYEKETISRGKWRFSDNSRDDYFEVEVMP